MRERAATKSAVHAGRSCAWRGRLVGALSGNEGNRVIGVEAGVECRIVWMEVAEVGDFVRRG
jgi:hypothetical protein